MISELGAYLLLSAVSFGLQLMSEKKKMTKIGLES